MASGRGDRTLPPKMAHKRQRGGDIDGSDDGAAAVELGGEPVREEPLLLMSVQCLFKRQ